MLRSSCFLQVMIRAIYINAMICMQMFFRLVLGRRFRLVCFKEIFNILKGIISPAQIETIPEVYNVGSCPQRQNPQVSLLCEEIQ